MEYIVHNWDTPAGTPPMAVFSSADEAEAFVRAHPADDLKVDVVEAGEAEFSARES